ncbi:MAG: DUF4954 family protein [Chlorobi bacterium]|nr:DUF4954 family protein [Chlorobiota bacterium]
MNPAEFRLLTREEIILLQQQHCHAVDWNQVKVKDPFSPEKFREVYFSGEVYLGCQQKDIHIRNGYTLPSGIYMAAIHHCSIGDNVHISRVHGNIAHYRIGEGCVIRNIDTLEVTGPSTFGNGTRVNVLDETGGRQIPIYDFLSAHLAYVLTLYRHRPRLIETLVKMIDAYAGRFRSETGVIEKGVSITHTRLLKNVKIGPFAIIEGTGLIENTSIHSTKESPVLIGSDVIIKNSIISSGATVTDGTILEQCFVGQSTHLAKQYSAEHSLFFANCAGFHGEACSVFAGPFTVSHHKSTLLIAGMFSFLNAGSGSNQSNHMYKLGPIHHGIVERGSKTTSDSYLLWPARVGPFTLVMGRHYKNSDTSTLPFSYLIENKDESYLAPGVNLRSVGTIRDAQKWPRRDKRKEKNLLDYINFNLLSPYTIDKMIRGRDLLLRLQEHSGEKSEFYVYENVKITRSSLKRGIQLYQMGINKFLGNSLISRLRDRDYRTADEIRQRLRPDSNAGLGPWVDMAGLIAPKNEVDQLLDNIENGKIRDLDHIHGVFKSFYEKYYTFEWTWAFNRICQEKNISLDKITPMHIIKWVETWKESVVALDKMLYEDARKEFTLSARTGFGADGDGNTREQDFDNVRGRFENNQQVREIIDHIRRKTELGDSVIARMQKI